ncbi:UNVERIFIED_CONTAM: D-alanyl-D-alanine carboxypeptidase (penicillin-binding protein 5/6) [Brevibacillus sp. OAP136]
MKVSKLFSGGLVVFLFLQLLVPMQRVSASPKPPSISAEAAALIDVASGRILYEKKGEQKMRIASLTKTMTAIVAIESSNLSDSVTVPPEAVGVEGSSIYLKNGEKLTLEDLLYGLMLRSGNDAAVTIATHVGGSVPGFVQMMNEKAAMIGMIHTNFMNPHGLDDSNMHYSTADDMVRLSAYALKNPVFRQIVSTKVKNIAWEGESWERRLQNKNKMLNLYKGADGVKTGYTKLAKRCLASSATRDGRQLAVITLNAPDDWDDSMALMDWGFSTFQTTPLLHKGDAVQGEFAGMKNEDHLRVTALNDFSYPLMDGEKDQVHTKVQMLEKNLTVKLVGKHIGFVEFYKGDQLIGRIPLTASKQETSMATVAQSVEAGSFWGVLWTLMIGGLWDA